MVNEKASARGNVRLVVAGFSPEMGASHYNDFIEEQRGARKSFSSSTKKCSAIKSCERGSLCKIRLW